VCITAGGKRRQLAANCQRQKASYCDKFVAAFCRFLSLRFCPVFSPTISLGDGVFDKLPADKGKTNVRFHSEPMLWNVPVNTISTHPLVAVCANPKFDYMSPVVASMYCSPHPAALHIAPAARLRELCF
jgi:hypothetical protein